MIKPNFISFANGSKRISFYYLPLKKHEPKCQELLERSEDGKTRFCKNEYTLVFLANADKIALQPAISLAMAALTKEGIDYNLAASNLAKLL